MRCKPCLGSGKIRSIGLQKKTCKACGGSGEVFEEDKDAISVLEVAQAAKAPKKINKRSKAYKQSVESLKDSLGVDESRAKELLDEAIEEGENGKTDGETKRKAE